MTIEGNLLNRAFTAQSPNQKWRTDVTFLQYGRGCKAYLSAIKDLYDGSIVAYHISKHNENHLLWRT
ncbi:transposase InsO family protein [Streptococcus rupicaprae]|uniref:Transposase InsO family protein n=1 Tax=Streptococcus rupicaprae TaxID=759619 RepID=A0ABV2FGX3_9STRE